MLGDLAQSREGVRTEGSVVEDGNEGVSVRRHGGVGGRHRGGVTEDAGVEGFGGATSVGWAEDFGFCLGDCCGMG